MKALTLWQPWASLIASGDKNYETRSWRTDYRGLLAIHAAKKFDSGIEEYCFMPPFRRLLLDAGYGTAYDVKAKAGKVLCVVELRNCHLMGPGKPPGQLHGMTKERLALGDFSPGRYAWQIKLVEVFDEPIPARGKQGLWNWEPPVSALPGGEDE